MNDPIGFTSSKAMTVDDVIIDGEPRLGVASGMWSVPFFVPGSSGHYALIDCSGYTELSAYMH